MLYNKLIVLATKTYSGNLFRYHYFYFLTSFVFKFEIIFRKLDKKQKEVSKPRRRARVYYMIHLIIGRH